jgi:hypothetical protein
MSTSYAIFTFADTFPIRGLDSVGADFGSAVDRGIAMTIKLVMMAAMYCVIVLGPQLFPKRSAKPADRA